MILNLSKVPFIGTLGRAEAEIAAHKIVLKCQAARSWDTIITSEDFQGWGAYSGFHDLTFKLLKKVGPDQYVATPELIKILKSKWNLDFKPEDYNL